MKHNFAVSLSVLLLVAPACGPAAPNENNPPSTSEPPGTMTEETINGLPASDFYAKLSVEKTGGYTRGQGSMPTQSNGDNAFTATLFLRTSNKGFVLFYDEGEGGTNNLGRYYVLRKGSGRRVSGTWTLQGATLVLGDVMTCGGVEMNGGNALLCKLLRGPGSADASGRMVTLERYAEKASPEDARWADYRD